MQFPSFREKLNCLTQTFWLLEIEFKVLKGLIGYSEPCHATSNVLFLFIFSAKTKKFTLCELTESSFGTQIEMCENSFTLINFDLLNYMDR